MNGHLVVQPIGGNGTAAAAVAVSNGAIDGSLNLSASGTSTGVPAISSTSTATHVGAAPLSSSSSSTTLPKVSVASPSTAINTSSSTRKSAVSLSSGGPSSTRSTTDSHKTSASSTATTSTSAATAVSSTASTASTPSNKLPQIPLKTTPPAKSGSRVRIDEQANTTSSNPTPNHHDASDTSRSTKSTLSAKRGNASTKSSPRLLVRTEGASGGSNGASPRSPRSAKSSARGVGGVRSPHRTPGNQSPIQSPIRPRTLEEVLGFFPNVAPNSSQLVTAALTAATSLMSPSAASAIMSFGQAPAQAAAAAAAAAPTDATIVRPSSASPPPILLPNANANAIATTTSTATTATNPDDSAVTSRYVPPSASSPETDQLILAIQANRGDLVLSLIMKQPIEWRCDFVNSYDENGCTGLFYALAPERIDCMQLLLDFGADVNHLNNKKNSCLHVACVYNYKKAIKTLIEYGANPQRENWEHQMPPQMLKTSEKQSQMLNYINACREQHNQNLVDKKYVPVDRYVRSYYRSMYELMDVKHVNALTQDVLEPMLDGWKKGELQEGESKQPDPQFFKQWFTQSDLDKNGVLSFAEFLMGMISMVAERDKALKKAKKLAMLKAKKAAAAAGGAGGAAGGAAKRDGFASPSVLSP